MAKKIKFPLTMKDDVQVRDLDELKANFDIDKAIGYFLDGKLLTWLEARYYDMEAEAVRNLNKDDADVHRRLCEIFGVEYHAEEAPEIDVEAVAERNHRLVELKQYTSDAAILEKIDQVAFNQEELADLIDDGYNDIYLCNNSFVIPLRVRNKRYIGVGKVEAVIRSQERVEFDELGIVFENIHFNDDYAKANKETPEQLYNLGTETEEQKLYENAFQYYRQAAEKNYVDAMFKVGYFYDCGHGVSQDYAKSVEWYQKAAGKGHVVAMNNLGAQYEDGKGVDKNIETAKEWYQKAAELGSVWSMKNLANILYNESNYARSLEWYQKASDLGNAYSSYSAGWQYEFGQGTNQDIPRAQELYRKAVDGYSSENPNHDPVFRYGRNLVFVYHDIESAKQWFKEHYSNDREKKVSVLNSAIQRLRSTPIPKQSNYVSFLHYSLEDGWSMKYNKNELINLAKSIIAKFCNGVVSDFNKSQHQYESLIRQEYMQYLMAATVCGAQNISYSDVDSYVSSCMQQINQITSTTIEDPTSNAIACMEFVENVGTGGLFAKRTYRIDNRINVEHAIVEPVKTVLEELEQKTYNFVCQAMLDLAADLERMKRSI